MNCNSYRQLDVSKREIRLLVLAPALEESQELIGSLTHVSLNDSPSYEALSYTWGRPPYKYRVLIDGSVFHIGPNLEGALRKLRKPDEPRKLWVDALCINQNDDSERRQQVPEMRNIFSAATQVLAWIGEAGEYGELAITLLEELQEEDLAAFRSARFESREWKALKTFWSRPYWKRIWVVQELAVGSRRALIGCGRKWIPRNKFERALDILIAHRNNYETLLWEALESEMDWFLNLSLICRNVAPSGEAELNMQDLEYLLYLTEHFEATQPHDHFFALLGLSQQIDRAAIPVDYSGCFADICAKVILHIIQRTNSLNVLSGNRSKTENTLSSWMPSFSDPVRRGYGWNSFRTFQTAGNCIASVTLSPCRRCLSCEGIEVGSISSFEGPFLNSKSEFLDARAFVSMRRIAKRTFMMSRRHPLAPTRNLLDRAFWESLFANRSVDMGIVNSSPDLPLEQFDALVALLDGADTESEDILKSIDDELHRCIASLICGLVSTLRFRCFFATSNGFVGVGPYNIKHGDLVVAFSGADVPFVLRRNEKEGYHLVGDAFVYGVMDGQLFGKGNERQHFQLK